MCVWGGGGVEAGAKPKDGVMFINHLRRKENQVDAVRFLPTTARPNQLTVSRERMRKRQMCKRLGPVPVRCSKYPLLLLLLLSAMITMNQQHTVGLNMFLFLFFIFETKSRYSESLCAHQQASSL